MLQTTLPTKIVHYHRIVNKGTQGESDKNKENSQEMHKFARALKWGRGQPHVSAQDVSNV